jgi:hypothetical protein
VPVGADEAPGATGVDGVAPVEPLSEDEQPTTTSSPTATVVAQKVPIVRPERDDLVVILIGRRVPPP